MRKPPKMSKADRQVQEASDAATWDAIEAYRDTGEMVPAEKDGKLVYGNVDNEWVNNVVIDGQQTQDQVCLNKFIPLDRQVSKGNLGIGYWKKPWNGVWRFGGFKLVDVTDKRDKVFRRIPQSKTVKNNQGFDYYVYDKGDFNLAEDSVILKECPGFVPIPWDRIGLYKDKWRAVLPEEQKKEEK